MNNEKPSINQNYPEYNYKLTPFKLFTLQNFPYIEADFDAITNYQLFCKVVEYLNEVIANENTVESIVQQQIDNINILYNWFLELDVQDEINNKLDDMAQNGELNTIIGEYLTSYIDEFNSRLNSQDVKIDALESGSPLVASSTSGMTDTSRIYVNTTDGKWYYYNGSAWTIGGTYQATALSDINTDTLNSLNFFVNLFNNNYSLAFPILGYIRDDGTLREASSSSYYTSEFLYIDLIKDLIMGSYISSTASVKLYNFYDSTKAFLGRSNDLNDYKNYSTKFIRICRHKNYNGPQIANSLSKLATNRFWKNTGQKLVTVDDVKQGAYVFGEYNPDNLQRICSVTYIPIDYLPYVFQINEGYDITIQYFSENLIYIDYQNWFTGSKTVTPPENAKYMLFNIREHTQIEISPSDIENMGLNYTNYIPYNDNVVINAIPNTKWANKTINFIGDSISAGHNIGSENAWPEVCCRVLGATCNNYAISGSTIADYNNLGEHTPIVNRFNEMSDDADLVIIMAGRNDYREVPVPIGNPDDTVTNTFYGALNNLFTGLWEKYPTKQVIFITSYKAMVNSTPIKRDNEWTNAIGNTQIDYNNAILEKCKEYSIPVINLYEGETITSWNEYQRPYFFIDTVHPSIVGCEFLGNLIATKLNNF